MKTKTKARADHAHFITLDQIVQRRNEYQELMDQSLSQRIKEFEAEFPGCRVVGIALVNDPRTRVKIQVEIGSSAGEALGLPESLS